MDGQGLIFPPGQEIFLFSTESRPAGPTQPIQWVLGAVSPGIKRPEREADHPVSSSAEVKDVGAIPTLPQHFFMAWCLIN
jgi:hypothetical protein